MPLPICPECSSEFVKRLQNTRSFREILLGVFHVYPFRCQLCGHRFCVRDAEIEHRSDNPERREYERMTMSFPLSFAGDSIEGKGLVLDITIRGCTFHTDAELHEGAVLRLTLQISNDLAPVNIKVAVVRTVRPNRIGVEFLDVDPGEKERLQLFISGLFLGRPFSQPSPEKA